MEELDTYVWTGRVAVVEKGDELDDVTKRRSCSIRLSEDKIKIMGLAHLWQCLASILDDFSRTQEAIETPR